MLERLIRHVTDGTSDFLIRREGRLGTPASNGPLVPAPADG
jgi:hypothetical protein